MSEYCWRYRTPESFSDLLLWSDGEVLTGVHFMNEEETEAEEKLLPIFSDAIKWLDDYFQGKEPEALPGYRLDHLTPFRQEVISELLCIPYGKLTTYGQIARKIADRHGIRKMSAQAVGNAVGWNPLCIMIPCHRVIGTNRDLTGYGGGMRNKIALLKLEGHDMKRFHCKEEG